MSQTLPPVETGFAIEAIYLQDAAAEWSCERAGECDNEAVFKALWMPDAEDHQGNPVDPCTCGPHSYLICLPCHDLFRGQTDGLGWCGKCSPTGPKQFKSIVAVERLRNQ